MTSKNKFNPEVALLNQVTDLLMDERVKQNEREILLNTKHQMEHHVNMPNIIYHLKNILAPLAIGEKLSPGMGKLYCDIVAGNIGKPGSLRTGIGMGTHMVNFLEAFKKINNRYHFCGFDIDYFYIWASFYSYCVLWLNLMHMLSIYDDNVEKKPFLLELYM